MVFEAQEKQTDDLAPSLKVPVLLLTFNRPKPTARVFAAIRDARPIRLYVAADGPRPGRNEEALCAEARAVATRVDWSCEIKTLFRDRNLGCRKAVSEAIDWFFEHESEGVVLEDDCLPDPTFFPYAAELLRHYRDDERVMCISAQHFPGAAHAPPQSYFLSRYNHCWGWATWRRAWQHYDRDMSQWPALRSTRWLLDVGVGNPYFQRYWSDIFDRCYAGKIDSWAYRWTFSVWSQNGLTALPGRNLVCNIGFGSDATHTKSSSPAALPLEQIEFPLTHPVHMARDSFADRWTDANHYRIPQTHLAALYRAGGLWHREQPELFAATSFVGGMKGGLNEYHGYRASIGLAERQRI